MCVCLLVREISKGEEEDEEIGFGFGEDEQCVLLYLAGDFTKK